MSVIRKRLYRFLIVFLGIQLAILLYSQNYITPIFWADDDSASTSTTTSLEPPSQPPSFPPKGPPNIIWIVADDYGHHDIGYNINHTRYAYASQLTPNLDYLSHNGITLDNYYTLCVCSASRGVMLTGRYDLHNGLMGITTRQSTRGIHLDETLVSEVLQRYGNYTTYALGKWHVGQLYWSQTPTWRGFDYFYGLLGGEADYFLHTSPGRQYDWGEHRGRFCNHTGCARMVEEDYGEYSTHLLSRKSVEIIRNHSSAAESTPFFIYLAYQSIHTPLQVPQEYIDRFKQSIPLERRRVGAAMINAMDEGIGNITQALERYQLADNTIVIFTSDNGAAIGTADGNGGENWPLRGAKHSIFEGGTKVPAVLYYPPLTKQNKAIQYKSAFHSADWMPTLIEAANIDLSKVLSKKNINGSVLPLQLDGVSHWSMLQHQKNENDAVPVDYQVRQWIYYGFDNPNMSPGPGGKFGLRFKQYKYMPAGGGIPHFWMKRDMQGNDSGLEEHWLSVDQDRSPPFLFDIDKDPLETHNIFGSQAQLNDVLDAIKQEEQKLRASKHADGVKCLCPRDENGTVVSPKAINVPFSRSELQSEPKASNGGTWPKGC